MGKEARARGTFEQRRAAAIERKRKTLEETRKELQEIPDKPRKPINRRDYLTIATLIAMGSIGNSERQ